jgi:hypothetical protein
VGSASSPGHSSTSLAATRHATTKQTPNPSHPSWIARPYPRRLRWVHLCMRIQVSFPFLISAQASRISECLSVILLLPPRAAPSTSKRHSRTRGPTSSPPFLLFRSVRHVRSVDVNAACLALLVVFRSRQKVGTDMNLSDASRSRVVRRPPPPHIGFLADVIHSFPVTGPRPSRRRPIEQRKRHVDGWA